MAKKYTVAVIGLLIKNGTVADYGTEITGDQVDNLEKRVEEGYLVEKKDFDQAAKDAQDLIDQEEKDKAAKIEQDRLDAIKTHNDLLTSYKTAFKVDAPADATDDAIADAVKNKKAIGS